MGSEMAQPAKIPVVKLNNLKIIFGIYMVKGQSPTSCHLTTHTHMRIHTQRERERCVRAHIHTL